MSDDSKKIQPLREWAADKAGPVSVELGPNKDEIRVYWANTPQEGRQLLTLKLNEPLDKTPFAALLPLEGTVALTFPLDSADGKLQRPVAVKAAETSLTDQTELTVAFKARDAEGVATAQPAPVPAVTYGKANYVNGLEYMEEWRATWLQAVALAWSDKHLEAQLLEDPYNFFKLHCNYRLPPTVDLVVVKDDRQESDTFHVPDAGRPSDWTWTLPRSVLIMFLPPAPAAKDQAIALAAYEAVGKQYPFTMTS